MQPLYSLLRRKFQDFRAHLLRGACSALHLVGRQEGIRREILSPDQPVAQALRTGTMSSGVQRCDWPKFDCAFSREDLPISSPQGCAGAYLLIA
jgi:hypothetical protein